MSFHAETHGTINLRFKNLVEDVIAGLAGKVAYDNLKFEKPNDGVWVRWTILDNVSNQVSGGCPGNNRHRSFGIAIAQVFGDLETGSGTLLETADIIKKAFQAVTDTGVLFRTPAIKLVGRDDNKWWQYNVECPWQADEFA